METQRRAPQFTETATPRRLPFSHEGVASHWLQAALNGRPTCPQRAGPCVHTGRLRELQDCNVAHVLLANHRMYNACRALRQCLNPSAPRRNHPDCWSARMLPPLFGRMSTRPHPPPAIRIQVVLTISGEPLERFSTIQGSLYRVSTSGGPLLMNLLLSGMRTPLPGLMPIHPDPPPALSPTLCA